MFLRWNVTVAVQGFRATFAKPQLTDDEMQVSCDLTSVNSKDGMHLTKLYGLFVIFVTGPVYLPV